VEPTYKSVCTRHVPTEVQNTVQSAVLSFDYPSTMGFLGHLMPPGRLRGTSLTLWFAIGCGADMALYGYDQVCALLNVTIDKC
jgi:hypothetical protein